MWIDLYASIYGKSRLNFKHKSCIQRFHKCSLILTLSLRIKLLSLQRGNKKINFKVTKLQFKNWFTTMTVGLQLNPLKKEALEMRIAVCSFLLARDWIRSLGSQTSGPNLCSRPNAVPHSTILKKTQINYFKSLYSKQHR